MPTGGLVLSMCLKINTTTFKSLAPHTILAEEKFTRIYFLGKPSPDRIKKGILIKNFRRALN